MFVIKEFQTTCLILLTDCVKDNVPYLLATAANRSRIKWESEYNIVLSLTNIFFQKTNLVDTCDTRHSISDRCCDCHTLGRRAKDVGRNEMPFEMDTRATPSNIILGRNPGFLTGKGDLGS